MDSSISRRRFSKSMLAAGGLAAAALGVRSTSALAMRPGPTSSTDIKPEMTQFVEDLITRLGTNDPSQLDGRFAGNALNAIPEDMVEGHLFTVYSCAVDLAGEVNLGIVYSGLRKEGGIYYDFLHLKAGNDSYVVTEWENRLPTPTNG